MSNLSKLNPQTENFDGCFAIGKTVELCDANPHLLLNGELVHFIQRSKSMEGDRFSLVKL
ncbi:hypothetical protein IEQ34_007051 [Dendrobium chrysotoxum]|uniref:Uncharacterized protein n=1 Tax=Dendrobium chrysotoxum TaxID=161865 RepID=A0AAV7GQY8_DENCH|nr:hypothetical protein IEQ34_007051 [Dendrobium chrysotoxum]